MDRFTVFAMTVLVGRFTAFSMPRETVWVRDDGAGGCHCEGAEAIHCGRFRWSMFCVLE